MYKIIVQYVQFAWWTRLH